MCIYYAVTFLIIYKTLIVSVGCKCANRIVPMTILMFLSCYIDLLFVAIILMKFLLIFYGNFGDGVVNF